MEMEVVVPVDFNFDSACSSPYMTAPSSPHRFGSSTLFFSAPTSPTRSTAFYNHLQKLDDDVINKPRYSSSSIPFKWEQKPGIPKSSSPSPSNSNVDAQDFEFDFSGHLDTSPAPLSAEELFDGGKIRPLKPPPRLHLHDKNISKTTTTTTANDYDPYSSITSPKTPPRLSRISQGKKIIQEALSPRHKNKDFDPFSAAIEETRRKCYGGGHEQQQEQEDEDKDEEEEEEEEKKRGRPGRRSSSFSSGFVRKGTRSLSPLRVSDVIELDEEDNSTTTMEKTVSETKTSTSSSSSSSSSSAYSSILQSAISFSKGYKKWKLKDFLLFRSASEGRATSTSSKDPLRKYTVLSKKSVVENSSFRSTESVGSVSSRRRGPVSAHEMHYTVNRAVSEEMRKKTVLPYKHGLLGCLGNFNHATGSGMQDISRSFGSFTRG